MATFPSMAALLKLDLCKDCRDLFLCIYKLYFILLWGKPLSNQNLCSMSDLLPLGRAEVLAYKESSPRCGALCALPAFSAMSLGCDFLAFLLSFQCIGLFSLLPLLC